MNIELNKLQNNESMMQSFQAVDTELNKLFPKRLIQKVLLICPPDINETMFNFSTSKRRRYGNYPPYGLGVIATFLKGMDVDVQILNLNHEVLKACGLAENEESFDFKQAWNVALASTIESFQPDFVGITCMFSHAHRSTVAVCQTVKELAPSVPISLGGVHVTNFLINDKTSTHMARDFEAASLFFVFEAEQAFKNFVLIVNQQLPISELAQIFVNVDGERIYFSKKLVPSEEEIDVIPAYDLMPPTDLTEYGTIGAFLCFKDKKTRFATTLANRGCRAQCTFCSVRNFNGIGVRHRSISSIIDELVMLRDEYGIEHVMWLDDDFLHGKKRIMELFNEMVRQNVNVTWDCTNGVIATSCTDEVIAAAAESGCVGLNIGMESGNADILKEIKKPGSLRQFMQAAEVLRKYEQIVSRIFLIIGFPGETYRQILDTIHTSLKMNLDWCSITILQPLPNTPIFQTMLDQGLLDDVNFEEIRFNNGPYGKHRKLASQNLLAKNFQDAFSSVNIDSVPPKYQLDDIWAYMNYHLNFKRLFKEDRPVKLKQQIRYVNYITDLVAPENAFAMYFDGYLQKKLNGEIQHSSIQRLEDHLSNSEYWQKKFVDFKLSVDHLKTGIFPLELEQEATVTTA